MAAKKATSAKKSTPAKKTTSAKKSTRSRNSASRSPARSGPQKRKAVADKTRKDLISKLKKDLQASQKALKAANKAAKNELKLVKAAAKAEIDVLKDQLSVAIKHEEALRKLSQEKAKKMWQAGEQWEKQQLARLKQTFKRVSRSRG